MSDCGNRRDEEMSDGCDGGSCASDAAAVFEQLAAGRCQDKLRRQVDERRRQTTSSAAARRAAMRAVWQHREQRCTMASSAAAQQALLQHQSNLYY